MQVSFWLKYIDMNFKLQNSTLLSQFKTLKTDLKHQGFFFTRIRRIPVTGEVVNKVFSIFEFLNYRILLFYEISSSIKAIEPFFKLVEIKHAEKSIFGFSD